MNATAELAVNRRTAKVAHFLAEDGGTSLCGREMTIKLDNGTEGRSICADCTTVASALTEGNDSATMTTPGNTTEGGTVSDDEGVTVNVGRLHPIVANLIEHKGATMAETTKRSADEIKADIDAALEAIGSADSEEKVTGLAAQITDDLKGLRGAPKQQRAMQLKEAVAAAEERLRAKPAEVVTATDWRTQMEGGEERAEELFKAAVERVKEGAKLGTEAVKLYDEICNVLLEARLSLPYKGLPDLQARSRAAKSISADVFDEAKKGIDEDEVDLLDFHNSLRKGVTNRMGDKVVTWLRALDESTDREVFEATFPQIAEGASDDVKPSDLIRQAYKTQIGIDLPTQTRAEQMALQRANRKALEAKKEAGEELGREELKALGEAVEPTPAEKVVVSVGKVNAAAKAVKPITAEDVAALDEEARKAFKAQLEADISAMREVYALFI